MGWMVSEPITETITLLEKRDRNEHDCESRFHATEAYHDGAATHLLVGGCEHTMGYRCEPFVKFLLGQYPGAPRPLRLKCAECKTAVSIDDVRFIPWKAGWL